MRRILKAYSPDVFEISENFITVVFRGDRAVDATDGATDGVVDGVVDGVEEPRGAASLDSRICRILLGDNKLKQHEIAKSLCVSVRTVSRAFARLTAEGMIARKGDAWEVSERVREHVCGHVCEHVERIVAACAGEMTEKELREAVGMKNRSNFTVRYLARALEGGYLERTDKGVRSRTQKYRLTEAGRALAIEIAKRRRSVPALAL